jgi:predicted RNA binding protein YcfA (HicA-like mRNA interferase family)
MKRDLAKLLPAARARGWQVAPTCGGHWKLTHPGGGIVVTSSSPSDHRALANLRAQLRRVERGRLVAPAPRACQAEAGA